MTTRLEIASRIIACLSSRHDLDNLSNDHLARVSLRTADELINQDKVQEAIDHFELQSLLTEVDCRIEHGAQSGGHLEYVRDELKKIMNGGAK